MDGCVVDGWCVVVFVGGRIEPGRINGGDGDFGGHLFDEFGFARGAVDAFGAGLEAVGDGDRVNHCFSYCCRQVCVDGGDLKRVDKATGLLWKEVQVKLERGLAADWPKKAFQRFTRQFGGILSLPIYVGIRSGEEME